MRRALTLLALGLSLGLAPVSAASVVPPLTLEQQAKKAEVIARVKLGTPQVVKEGDLSYRAFPLTVTEVIAGDVANLPQAGGQPALFVLDGLQGLPTLTAGQEGVALMYTRKADSPFVGFWQGWYALEGGKVKLAAPATPATAEAPAVPGGLGAAPPLPSLDAALADPVRLREALLKAREGAK